MTSDRSDIPSVQGYHCFACGSENPMGLHMTFYRQGDAVCSDLSLDARFVGWENMAHGGVVSAVLDEVMAWTILHHKRTFCVTRKITVRFVKPVPVMTPITARGRLVPSGRTHTCLTAGELLGPNGEVLARASADFALLQEEQLSLLPVIVRTDMARFIDQLGPLGIEGIASNPIVGVDVEG